MSKSNIFFDCSLRPYNTFGVSVKARRFISVTNVLDLKEMMDAPVNQIFVLGGGSNVLFTKDFEGTILKNDLRGIEMIEEHDDHVIVGVGSGENWHQFVLWCLERNYGGVENLALIPGTVGAAPIQNIGAYGVEFEAIFQYLEAITLNSGEFIQMHYEDCHFGYRDSIFKTSLKGKYLITKVVVRLTRKKHPLNTSYGAIKSTLVNWGIEYPTIQHIAKAVIAIRMKKLPDPNQLGNAGSFFKNPVVSSQTFEKLIDRHPNMPNYPQSNDQIKLAAGWLIDQCGWKGVRKGDAGVFERQALVLVNYGRASGVDILNLARDIQESVMEQFSVRLEPEVNII